MPDEYEDQRGSSTAPPTAPPRGTQEWYEQQQDGGIPPANEPKGRKGWAERVNAVPPSPPAATTSATKSSEVKVSTDVETPGATAITDIDAPSASATTRRNSDDADTAGSDRKIKTLQDVIDTLEPQETAEQRKKRERRERSAKIISAVSDGLMAMSNLFFTSRYAPNMYNHEKSSQLNAQNAAIEKARRDREANADKYLRFALALGDAENERAKTAREVEAEQERRRLAREKAGREQEAHRWLAALQPDKQREQAGKANKAEEEARTAKAEADNAPALQKAKLATEQARKGSLDASASNSRASAAAHNRSNRQVVHHFNGKIYPKGSNDYEKDVREAARRYNERHGKWVEEVDVNGEKTRKWKYDEGFIPIDIDYKDKDRINRPRKAEEYAGEVETALARESEDNTPPSRRKNKDNTPPSRR